MQQPHRGQYMPQPRAYPSSFQDRVNTSRVDSADRQCVADHEDREGNCSKKPAQAFDYQW